jgi:hypothetical protein
VKYVRGAGYAFDGSFTVHNAGPSAALPGELTYRAQIGFLQGAIDNVVSPVKSGPPFRECTTSTPGVVTGRVALTCPFGVFPAGATATVHVRVVVKIPDDESPNGVYQMLFDWMVNSIVHGTPAGTPDAYTPDPKTDNNAQSEIWHLCGPQAADPKCPKS